MKFYGIEKATAYPRLLFGKIYFFNTVLSCFSIRLVFFVIVWYNPAITKREVYAAATTD